MRKELEDALIKDFPQLYDHERFKADGGFRIGDGWEAPIRRMSERLMAATHDVNVLRIESVKSKLSMLRVLPGEDIFRLDEEVYDAVEEILCNAAAECIRRCEACGNREGDARGATIRRDKHGFWYAYCDFCNEEYLKTGRHYV